MGITDVRYRRPDLSEYHKFIYVHRNPFDWNCTNLISISKLNINDRITMS